MTYTVYCHTNKINGKKYVGITSKKPEARWQNGTGYKTQMFGKAIEKYGWEEFAHEILFTGLTEKEAKEKEIELIKKWNTNSPECGYNLTVGGDGTVGYFHSDASKRKMSEAHCGLLQSEETREKHRQALSGIKRSEETKAKMSEYAKNRSEEHKEKLSKALTGVSRGKWKKHTEEHIWKSAIKRAKPVRCIETGTVYFGVYEAGRQLGISGSLINKVLRGERNHTHGYHFEYVENKVVMP